MKLNIQPHHIKEIAYYTFLTFGGLIIDFGIANLSAYWLGIPLIIAGAIGLIAGTITNYFIHLNITFRARNIKASWSNFIKYVKTCLAGAATRLILLALFASLTNFSDFFSLLCATGCSFLVNYLLSRFYVFKSPTLEE